MRFKVGDWVRLNIDAEEFEDSIKYLPLGVGKITNIHSVALYPIEVKCANFRYIFKGDELLPLNEGIDET